jgi:hypothetical protein
MALPSGIQALVWLGLCDGADSNFVSTLQPFVGVSGVYGFYVMDEPDPTGMYHPPACSAANLKAESDWIHANIPGTKTFIVMMNLGSDTAPSYANTYNPSNTGLDLYGLDPYPCQAQFSGCDDSIIDAGVVAAMSWGIPAAAVVPVYQAFGGGGYAQWTLPTAAQAPEDIDTWGSLIPNPPFDYVYAWGSQNGNGDSCTPDGGNSSTCDTALSESPDLQSVFAAHNHGTCIAGD